eukprot:c17941_g1_i1 orf=225-1949(+)
MLLPRTSPHCQPRPTSKTGIVSVPVKAFPFTNCRGLLRLLPLTCNQKTLLRIQWRWGNQILLCRRKLECGAKQMRCSSAVLSMEPGMARNTSKAVDNHGAVLSTNSSLHQEIQNQASLDTAKASAVGSLLGRLDSESSQEQNREEIERLRRKRISEANKGRAPWNKGRKGDSKTLDEGSTSQKKKVTESISLEERENLRRQRISEANRGRVPWNKGGKHSLETKHRIRVGVIERMKDPKIREKLRKQAEAVKLSPEIRLKIKNGIIRAWNAKRQLKARQELCVAEWKDFIAESARKGMEGDVVYQWDSYSTIKEQLQVAWQPPPRKKREAVPKADLSTEHRMRISAAIKAKWSDPNYRVSVQKGMQDSLVRRGMSSNPIVEKPSKPTAGQIVRQQINRHTSAQPKSSQLRTKRDRSSVRQDAGSLITAPKTDIFEPAVLKPNLDLPAFKDPDSEKKLEKLMSMRARRMYTEAQKQKEITERARALIAQAGEAAKALEAAAVKDKNAVAPLLETRRLLAEAVRSLESMNWKKSSQECIIKEDNSALYAHVMNLGSTTPSGKEEKHPELEARHFSE